MIRIVQRTVLACLFLISAASLVSGQNSPAGNTGKPEKPAGQPAQATSSGVMQLKKQITGDFTYRFVSAGDKAASGSAVTPPTPLPAASGTDNVIAIVEGEIKLVPGGQVVRAGEFARRNADGSITVAAFDPDKVLEGKLVYFNGLMPGFPEASATHSEPIPVPTQLLRDLEVQYRTQNLPGSINVYFPEPKEQKVQQQEKKPHATPTPTVTTPRPTPRPTPIKQTPPPRGGLRE